MKPGSVIVDLAVEDGGNCDGSLCDEIVDADGVTIVGFSNVAGRLAADASTFYARNLYNLITPSSTLLPGAWRLTTQTR